MGRLRRLGLAAALAFRVFVDAARRQDDADYETRLATQAARLESAVAAETAEMRRQRQLGDRRALAEALSTLAEARWRTGGQRSAALTDQREAVALTRLLVVDDPDAIPVLAVRPLRFAKWAEAIGLRTDAGAARAEAASIGTPQCSRSRWPAGTDDGTDEMTAASLDGRRFAAVANVGGEVTADTIFDYHERAGEVWATYRGGAVVRGFLVGTRTADTLDIRYVQLNNDGETSSGHCVSAIQVLPDGRLRLDEKWEWESRPGGGTSVVEELAP